MQDARLNQRKQNRPEARKRRIAEGWVSAKSVGSMQRRTRLQHQDSAGDGQQLGCNGNEHRSVD